MGFDCENIEENAKFACEVLRAAWTEQKYTAACPPRSRDPEEAPAHAVTAVIYDEFWWGYMACLLRLHSLPDELRRWSDECSCHYLQGESRHGRVTHASMYFREVGKTCFMKGKRVAELATGTIHDNLKNLAELSVQDLRQSSHSRNTCTFKGPAVAN